MGTNFYWADGGESDDPECHIGKRSAAGRWCWDCDATLLDMGKAFIHSGRGSFLDACPQCGMTAHPMPLDSVGNPAGMELGFAQPRQQRPNGVGGASSFTWAQDPEAVGVRCQQRADDELVVDEYGRRMTGRAFLEMLAANCPIQFTDSIGLWFC